MQLIDSHAHVFTKEFDRDRSEVMQRCILSGVEKIFLPNIDLSTIAPMMSMVAEFPETCFPMMGLHPCSVGQDYVEVLAEVEKWFKKEKFWAVGEIGIDLYWDKSLVKQQMDAFRIQCEWAKELGLPVVIHVRESFNEVFEVVDSVNDHKLTGIFHCFSGTVAQAEKIIGYGGFKLGIGGVVTFNNSGLADVLRRIHVEHLVLETDSPYLAPAPHRGMRNEPANIFHIANKLGAIYGLTPVEIGAITTKNALAVFHAA